MAEFSLKKNSILSRGDMYEISTNIANFHNVFPEYFKSIKITSQNDKTITAFETINFLGLKINVKTRHEIFEPHIHNVYILSGPLKGTSFFERYESDSQRTRIEIKINLKLNKILSIIPYFPQLMLKRMDRVFGEFILAAEDSFEKSILSK
ncbi:MAG: hypothetical protein LVO36_01720 [Nitrosopumilus sp. (ex Thoosa mismalolli)]|nr:hypothetical protein [Nitrosopumilus sp. (ex Thoosa mismalolli)]